MKRAARHGDRRLQTASTTAAAHSGFFTVRCRGGWRYRQYHQWHLERATAVAFLRAEPVRPPSPAGCYKAVAMLAVDDIIVCRLCRNAMPKAQRDKCHRSRRRGMLECVDMQMPCAR